MCDAGAAQRRVLSSWPGACTLPRTLLPAPSRAPPPAPPLAPAGNPRGSPPHRLSPCPPAMVPVPHKADIGGTGAGPAPRRWRGTMNTQRMRRLGIGIIAAVAVGIPATAAVATVPHYVTVKPAAKPASVTPKVTIHHGVTKPDRLGTSSVTTCSGGPGCWHAPAGQLRRVLVAARRELGHLQLPHRPRQQQPEPARRRPRLRPPPVCPRRQGQGGGGLDRGGVRSCRHQGQQVRPGQAFRRPGDHLQLPDLDLRAGQRGSAALRRLPDDQRHHRPPRPRPHRPEPPWAHRQTTAYTGWSWCEPRDGMCN